MDRPLTFVPSVEVRSIIAHRWLEPESAMALGSVMLRPHQREAVARARAALAEHGGALLADDVGLGKTFVALAIATEAHDPLIVAPAALRAMWAQACAQTGVRADFRSYQALSRRPMPEARHDLVILDEAHHARSTHTARYRHLARGVAGAHVLLLTATPVHNSTRDLRALVALFLGARAWAIDETELGRHVIRREREDVAADAIPALAPPRWLFIEGDDDLLDAIISLPSPVPPSDGGDGGALVSFTLARLWASSHAALRAGLLRRLQRARAMEDALATGRHPTANELRAWSIGDDAAQLAFPELVATAIASDGPALLDAVRGHAAALESLMRVVPQDSMRDGERAERLREVASRHAGEKVVAFTQFSDTASALFRLLRDSVRVCQLDGRGARVAGGRLSRREAIARFAPRATGSPEPRAAERIEMLIATDLLSEGVNLQDASVVVHLDLPWTAARMAQRVGRSRRMGALHPATSVYAFAPPAAAATLLRQEQRLREKLNAAVRLTGACGAILPVRLSLVPEPPRDEPTAPTREIQLLRDTIARWRMDGAPSSPTECALPVACVRASDSGALALFKRETGPDLVAVLGARVGARSADLLAAARLSQGDDAPADDGKVRTALAIVESWAAASAGAAIAGAGRTIAGAARRVAMQRIAHIAARTPRHHRALVAPLASEARRIITAPYGVGAERILAELAGAPLPDEAWLRAVRAFGEANCRRLGVIPDHADAGQVEALIVFGP
ncbi:MAG TPA: DEAD/DEAH box helicase [Gemmatimonadaceae bacterium]|nr:DEAD/DEAH box helicase [Gemmatimonadaceae bacterium]